MEIQHRSQDMEQRVEVALESQYNCRKTLPLESKTDETEGVMILVKMASIIIIAPNVASGAEPDGLLFIMLCLVMAIILGAFRRHSIPFLRFGKVLIALILGPVLFASGSYFLKGGLEGSKRSNNSNQDLWDGVSDGDLLKDFPGEDIGDRIQEICATPVQTERAREETHHPCQLDLQT
eukprot:5598231-Ditylum_brightwellii.AAC.1